MADNRRAYGLAKEHGIDTDGMTPKEVWDALREAGVTTKDGNEKPSAQEVRTTLDRIGMNDRRRGAIVEKSAQKHKEFKNLSEVDAFFLYDDDRRGLLAKKNSAHGKWDRALTPHQRQVMSDYAADGYSNINSYLRGYDNGVKYSVDYVKGAVKALDDAIDSYTSREPFITYRSIKSDAFYNWLDHFEDLVGTEYSDKGFMSTSPDPNSSALNKDVYMTIKVPSGKGIGAYINEYNNLGETEFLLARGSKFKITKASYNGKTYDVEMELIK